MSKVTSKKLNLHQIFTWLLEDGIVTKPEAATDVKVGQVVSLPLPNNPSQRYVHRVVSVSTKDGLPLLRTKGDANPAPESFVLRIDSPQVPVVVTTVPLLGHVSLLLQRPATRILLIVVTLSTIVLAAWRLFDGLWRPGHANHSTRRAA